MLGLVEKPLLRAGVRKTGGNQVQTARFWVSTRTLRKNLTEDGIDPDASGGGNA